MVQFDLVLLERSLCPHITVSLRIWDYHGPGEINWYHKGKRNEDRLKFKSLTFKGKNDLSYSQVMTLKHWVEIKRSKQRPKLGDLFSLEATWGSSTGLFIETLLTLKRSVSVNFFLFYDDSQINSSTNSRSKEIIIWNIVISEVKALRWINVFRGFLATSCFSS